MQFDALDELADLCLNNGRRTEFQGSLTVLHDDSHLMAWRALARGAAGPNGTEVRGMFHDVTDTEPPQIGLLTALRLSDVESQDNAAPAVLVAYRPATATSPSTPAIMYWVSARPGYIAESAVDHADSIPVAGNLIHPDDWPRFTDAARQLADGADDLEIPFPARLLGADGQWVQVRFSLRRYPGGVGEVLHIGRFSRLDDAAPSDRFTADDD
ncbi:hypothetical protein QSJ18_12205 [Gordonia sp. ABSL1-1]|uniref:hypothetical protein n=1 Tax=Gordonia sp. ABSL1-1 TaxID=3053923 RepID=UPI0025725263|nr:hypothetical protein [Gordonia sp. ABSL1-1]MDL9937510.1 hypothetical protein [Gordonia sp. ABSL1-1]